jgi:hypothetical protein
MNSRTNRIVVCAALVLAVAAFAQPARANLLVDPGFEVNALTSYVNVLTDFTTYQGIWGVENATIVTAENGITPAQGVQMLRMEDDGLLTTQGFQVTDVSSYAGLIDSGAGIVGLSALFNVDKGVPAAVAAVYLQFFSAANYGSQIGSYVGTGLTLDNLDSTWEMIAYSGAIPVNTRWVLSQVAYSDASLVGIDGAVHPGYVDAADLRITPEPASLGLLLLGAASMWMRRR